MSSVRSDKIRQDLEQFQEVYYKEQTTNQLMGLISIAYDMTHRLYMRVVRPLKIVYASKLYQSIRWVFVCVEV